jgi:threonine synthase
MLYYSTHNRSATVTFKEATIRGQAPDKGLYFPEEIPVLPGDFLNKLKNFTKEEIAFRVIQPYVADTIPQPELKRIVAETVAFDFPLKPLTDEISVLELFHGPTLAFKDVGARFMSRCLGYFVKDNNKKVTVLVATSGDTGGAVADGFYNVDGVDVVILYPSGKVSNIQELQLTTLGKNIRAIRVNGNFDDCQAMVKQAFSDQQLNREIFLTSANSINVARWLPQQFYYFFALQQWKDKQPPVISVPSGNFGNICAGMVAAFSGLPVQQFIAACNANDTVHKYLISGAYIPRQAIATLSNAMDVGNPSNFARIMELFRVKETEIEKMVCSYSITDEETKATLNAVDQSMGYTMDPHGAVAYLALKRYIDEQKQQGISRKGIFLETAHPVKFFDSVEAVIKKPVPLPDSVRKLLDKKKLSVEMDADYNNLKDFLVSK